MSERPTIDRYAWPGGYEIFYLIGTGIACQPCAVEAWDDNNDGEGASARESYPWPTFLAEDTDELVTCDFAWQCDHYTVGTNQ